MELIHGILRGLGSLKEGESAQLHCKVDPQEFVQLPSNTRVPAEIEFDLEMQCLGEDYVLTVKSVKVEVQAPCSVCSHTLQRALQAEDEYLSFEKQEVQSGEINLKKYLSDLLTSLIPECLPCEDNPCEWREDVDRFLAKNAQQKTNKPFHPFKNLLSEKKWKMSQE